MDINKIVNDPELWAEYCKAYAIAAHYRPAVQFKLAIFNMPKTRFYDDSVWNSAIKDFPHILLSAITGYICDDLKG